MSILVFINITNSATFPMFYLEVFIVFYYKKTFLV